MWWLLWDVWVWVIVSDVVFGVWLCTYRIAGPVDLEWLLSLSECGGELVYRYDGGLVFWVVVCR